MKYPKLAIPVLAIYSCFSQAYELTGVAGISAVGPQQCPDAIELAGTVNPITTGTRMSQFKSYPVQLETQIWRGRLEGEGNEPVSVLPMDAPTYTRT